MTATIDPYCQWDAAYVLGALSAKERLEFELHLTDCRECSAAVAELAGLPGLLARVPDADVGADLDAVWPTAPDLLPRLARSVRRQRFRMRVLAVGAVAIAAAAAAVLVVALPLGQPGETAPVQEATLSQVVQSPLHADVHVVSQAWGTKIDMTCRYAAEASDYPAAALDYALYVTDGGGHSSPIATWNAAPGSTVTLSGATSLRADAIRSVDVRSVRTGSVLLKATLAASDN